MDNYPRIRTLIFKLAGRMIDEEYRHWDECGRPDDHTYLILDELVKLANE